MSPNGATHVAGPYIKPGDDDSPIYSEAANLGGFRISRPRAA